MKIAFVGASGYGNVGDDTYRLVLREQLPEAQLLFFNSDLPEVMPSDLDLLVLGGGGILHNASEGAAGTRSPHFRCMSYYMNWAQASGIPWGVLSSGFQFKINRENFYRTDLAPWVDYLKLASFITLRSPRCVRIAEDLTGRTDIIFYPDAAYLFRPQTKPGSADGRSCLTLVPAGLINPRNRYTQHVIKLFLSMNYELAWLSMGAPVDDDGHLAEAKIRQPGARIFANPSPEEAFLQIGRSRMVMTGRYHGMIFARSQGVPFLVPEDSPYKIQQEDFSAASQNAAGHVETLREWMAKSAALRR